MHRRRAPTPPTSDPARLGAPMHPTRAPTPPTSGTAHVGGTSAQQTCTYAPNFRRHPTLGREVHHIDRCAYPVVSCNLTACTHTTPKPLSPERSPQCGGGAGPPNA